MRYQLKCDGFKIYDSLLGDTYKIFNANAELELNKTGSVSFDIYPTHSNFDKLRKLKSIIELWQNDDLIFRGRILNDEQGFYNQKHVVCEGQLAFLLDSIMRPYPTDGSEHWSGTPEEYLRMLIDNHNSQVDSWKKFKVRTVTVTDGDVSNTENQIQRSDSEYKNTLTLINEKLIGILGGYIWTEYGYDEESGENVIFIDYLSEFNVLGNQKIKFGKNLIDLKKTVKGEDVITALIPIGKNDDDIITISGINHGNDYIVHEEAASELGLIFGAVTFEGITSADKLLKKAKEYLNQAVMFSGSVELTAADLSGIDSTLNPFRLGRKIEIVDDKHGLEELAEEVSENGSSLVFLVEKLSLDILTPNQNTLTIGTVFKTFTETTNTTNSKQSQIVEKINTIEKNIADTGVTQTQLEAAKIELIEANSSMINQASNEIMTEVSQDFFLKDDADELVNSVSTQFTQTNEEFEYRFNEFSQDLEDVASGADAEFAEIKKYIRFVDGNIVLGEEGNELTLNIQKDRISFLESGVEVAYLSNRKLYVTDGEFINSLALGNFAFIPRASGNLSFKKVK